MKYFFTLIILFVACKFFAQDTLLINTSKVDIKQGCYIIKKNGLITSEEELKSEIIKARSYNVLKCESYSLPQFNFSNYNILWFDLNVGGGYLKDAILYKITSQKKYLFVINIRDVAQKINLMVSHTFQIRQLTPKLEHGYSFEYKIETLYK